ncbi:hypothetical protein C8Q76DRAFT_692005 [Earliella scabrosa]|nr:hypothetical protein C8Q76DRAFT_692005 [Earliella scabrosa]
MSMITELVVRPELWDRAIQVDYIEHTNRMTGTSFIIRPSYFYTLSNARFNRVPFKDPIVYVEAGLAQVTHIMPARDIVLDDCEPIGNLPRESHMDGELQYLHTNMRITVSVNEFTAHAVVNVVNPVLAVSGVILPGMAWVRTDIQVGRPYVRGQEHRYHLVELPERICYGANSRCRYDGFLDLDRHMPSWAPSPNSAHPLIVSPGISPHTAASTASGGLSWPFQSPAATAGSPKINSAPLKACCWQPVSMATIRPPTLASGSRAPSATLRIPFRPPELKKPCCGFDS